MGPFGTWKAFAAPASPFGLGRLSASLGRPTDVRGLAAADRFGGVAILPDDILIADQDGAVVIPKAMAQDVLESSLEAEALEEWILEQVKDGRKLPGLYPPNDDAKAEFLSWRSRR